MLVNVVEIKRIKNIEKKIKNKEKNKEKNIMKTIGDKLNQFSVVGVKPARLDYAEDAFETLTEKSFPGHPDQNTPWKPDGCANVTSRRRSVTVLEAAPGSHSRPGIPAVPGTAGPRRCAALPRRSSSPSR